MTCLMTVSVAGGPVTVTVGSIPSSFTKVYVCGGLAGTGAVAARYWSVNVSLMWQLPGPWLMVTTWPATPVSDAAHVPAVTMIRPGPGEAEGAVQPAGIVK